ncbi:MAG: hypothetical protein ACRECX_09635 [Methyloceanibacter sp.]|uniref:hypothetical protein n=1 Tax=Methyloceanibacter sp. TaxID=1965321 RepID=UPI003D6CBE60
MSATADLVITNGDAAGELLRHTLQGAEVLPWRDVLHEGPVPLTATLEELTAIRIEYLAGAGGGDIGAIEFELTARDRGLAMSPDFGRVVLWFEHDLYDQLQLLQVLDWFAAHPRSEADTLVLVQTEDYIGRQEPEAIEELASTGEAVTEGQLALANGAWAAFRQATPEACTSLLGQDLSALPFLRPSVLRMLEELPGTDGLSRTERHMLAIADAGSVTALALFVAVQKQEEAVFMGDWSFWRLLDALALADEPLIAGLEAAPFQHDVPELAKAYLTSRLGHLSRQGGPLRCHRLGGASRRRSVVGRHASHQRCAMALGPDGREAHPRS